MKCLVIIPSYNEEHNIINVISSLEKVERDIDYVLINDGSTDETCTICRVNELNVVSLPVNLGIGGAMQTGYKYALRNGYHVAIQFDGDCQHDPAFIEALIRPIMNGMADMAIGSRFISSDGYKSTILRRIGIYYFRVLIKILTRQTVTDATSGFRACNQEVIKLFSQYYPADYPEPETVVTLLRKKYRVIEVAVSMNERGAGSSSISLAKSAYYMIKLTLAILIDVIKRY